MPKKAIILLADGFEDVEAVTPVDYLSRAGIQVTTVSISENLTVTSKWGRIKILADVTLADLIKQNDNWDAAIVPGGMPGSANLAASRKTGELLIKMSDAKKLICAICAAPAIVLHPLGIIKGKNFTCYPGMEDKAADANWSADSVVIDDNIITSRGAGTAGLWSIAIIEKLIDKETAEKIAKTVLL
ncbi:MAG: DJ-1/PfpI family protein [Treponema sp.]|nr:DJ-1/PfpI family protein [Treponema sp.]